MANLLRQMLAQTRLRAALDRVLANQGRPGVDGVTVEDLAARMGQELPALQGEVLTGRYRPLPLLRLWLPRPGKPPRPIGVPCVRDRVLQTAAAQALMPLLEGEFEECSYAYRQGRSVRMAVERIGLLQRQGYQWVVEADITQFFDRIPHARLLAQLQLLCGDAELVALVERWLATPVWDAGERGPWPGLTGAAPELPPNRLGVPQGSPLSPALANLYLDHLDEALLDADHALVRYADDFVVLARSRQRAEDAVALSEEVLHDLALELNPLKTRVVNFEQGFKFLGWHFVRSLALPARKVVEAARAELGMGMGLTRSAAAVAVPAAALPAEQAEEADSDGLVGEMATAWAEALAAQPGWQAPASNPAAQPTGAEVESDDPGPDTQTLPDPGIAATLDRLDAAPASEDTDRPRLDLGPDPSLDTEPDPDPDSEDARAPAPLPSLQRTLYLVDPAASLHTENRRLLVRREQELLLELPAVNVDLVMLMGRNTVTTAALVCCMQQGIPVVLTSRMGRFYGRMEPPGGDAVRLQQAQFAAQADAALNLALARHFVHGKLANAARTLAAYARHRRAQAGAGAVQAALLQLRDLRGRLKTAPDLDTLRGLEGAGASAYFGAWRHWLAPTWTFGAREQQAGRDPINALLDLGYTLLYHAVAGLIQARGLTPWLGHLHAVKPGHMALASDLMEEFRAVVVDPVLLHLCLNGGLLPEDFIERSGVYTLKPAAVKRFIRAIEVRLNTERQPPEGAGAELQDLRRIIDAQVRRLAQVYRSGDAGLYAPAVFR
jgi:CRISPR-associated protein Cas1